MVRIVRVYSARFLVENENLKIEGQTLKSVIHNCTQKSVQDYIKDIVLKDKEDARDAILIVTPIVFRITLTVVLLELSEGGAVKYKIKFAGKNCRRKLFSQQRYRGKKRE